jgi:hypothetical protein
VTPLQQFDPAAQHLPAKHDGFATFKFANEDPDPLRYVLLRKDSL